MNISRCVSSLIMQLGLYNISLPFAKAPDQVIKEVLSTITIPIFSQFVPNRKEMTFNTKSLEILDRRQYLYKIPDILTTQPILAVLDVCVPQMITRGEYGDMTPAYGISSNAMGVIQAQSLTMLMGQIRSEPTFEWVKPNKIKLRGYPAGYVTIIVESEHDENGESIEASCYESFMQLAELDVKSFIYQNLKHYDNISTAFGAINLKVEEFQTSSQERFTLLQEWENLFHLDKVELIKYF